MKKVYALVTAAFLAVFCSCGGSTGRNVAEEDSLAIDTVATLEDSAMDLQAELTEKLQSGDVAEIKKAIEKGAADIQAVLESGDQEEAKKYASQIKAFVDENADKLKELDVNTLTVSSLVETIKKLPESVETTADEAKNAVNADAEAAKADIKAKADEAVEDAKTKADETVDDAANKAGEKVDQALQDAAAKAKEKLGL
ncbi:MAG: hypothetical protein ACI4B5_04065 [Bacteroidaceae bacterium]